MPWLRIARYWDSYGVGCGRLDCRVIGDWKTDEVSLGSERLECHGKWVAKVILSLSRLESVSRRSSNRRLGDLDEVFLCAADKLAACHGV